MIKIGGKLIGRGRPPALKNDRMVHKLQKNIFVEYKDAWLYDKT